MRAAHDLRVTAEPYDGEVAVALVQQLADDLNERYGEEDDGGAGWFAEVTPEKVAPPEGAFLVAWVDGRPVGCGGVKRLDATTAEVKRMFTAPEGRRRGVGRAVLRGLVDAARTLGYERVWLETGTKQPESMALYESEGFTPIPSYGRYRDDPWSRCYEKAL
jgi:GNAT superfamily N-acetyltransferase